MKLAKGITTTLASLLMLWGIQTGTFGKSLANVQNLVVNGDFEAGPAVERTVRIDVGSAAIQGWSVIRGSVDICGVGWTSVGGTKCIDLEGEAAFGGISQSIKTTPGQVYTVTFDIAGNPDGPPMIKKMKVQAAGQSTERWFDTTGASREDLKWVRHTWQFLANQNSTTLEFVSVAEGSGDFGALVDNVSVVAAREPWGRSVSGGDMTGASPAKGTPRMED